MTTDKTSPKPTKERVSVAKYIGQQLALSEKSQKDISAAIGYDRPNFLTMIKNGQSKLPIHRVAALARELGVDQMFFLRMVLSEYMPEVWATVEEVLEGSEKLTLSQEELQIIRLVREHSGNTPLNLADTENRQLLEKTIQAIAHKEFTEREAVRQLVDALPRNSTLRKSPKTA